MTSTYPATMGSRSCRINNDDNAAYTGATGHARSRKCQPRMKTCQPNHSHSANSAHRPNG